MGRLRILHVALGLIALACALPAKADVLSFTGGLTGRGVVGADASCAPLFRGTIAPASSTGISSLGGFTYGHTACTAGAAGGRVFGTFNIDFGSDGFEGTFDGLASPTATPPLSDLNLLYTILGGTGRFLGATGTFTGIGTADPRIRPSIVSLDLNGTINAPAVPEPGTWALLILGFGMVGASMRYRPARRAYA